MAGGSAGSKNDCRTRASIYVEFLFASGFIRACGVHAVLRGETSSRCNLPAVSRRLVLGDIFAASR
jgi:hypothetical protein